MTELAQAYKIIDNVKNAVERTLMADMAAIIDEPWLAWSGFCGQSRETVIRLY